MLWFLKSSRKWRAINLNCILCNIVLILILICWLLKFIKILSNQVKSIKLWSWSEFICINLSSLNIQAFMVYFPEFLNTAKNRLLPWFFPIVSNVLQTVWEMQNNCYYIKWKLIRLNVILVKNKPAFPDARVQICIRLVENL